MDIETLQDIQRLSIGKIEARLRDFSADDLHALRALEAETESPRAGLLTLIDKHLASGAEAGGAESLAAPPAEAPAWQAPDYTGPMTGDQAAWRREHVKPATVPVAK